MWLSVGEKIVVRQSSAKKMPLICFDAWWARMQEGCLLMQMAKTVRIYHA